MYTEVNTYKRVQLNNARVRMQNFSRPSMPVPLRSFPGGHYTLISSTFA